MKTLEEEGNDLKCPTASKEEEEEEMRTVTIPNEIIYFDILTRLPVKSLFQFRCVSKSWCSLIRHPSFSNLYLTRSLTDDRLDGFGLFISTYNKHSLERHLLSASHRGGPTTHLSTLHDSTSDPCVSEHVNGLFSIHRNGFNRINQSVYICNPSTRQIVTLPPTDSLVLSPSCQAHVCYNLGFDPSTNEHKVLNIRVVNLGQSARAECKIFTLGTDSWRKIDPVFPFDVTGDDWLYGFKESVCVNGVIYWMLWSTKNVIAAFDLREEKFFVVPLPDAAIPSKDFTCYASTVKVNRPYLIQLNGLLAVVCHEHAWERNRMEMWMLEDYQKQDWVEESITFPSCWEGLGRPYPKGTIPTGEILLKQQQMSRDCVRVPFYDVKKKSFRIAEISLFPEFLSSDDDCEVICAGGYIPSFLSLRRNE